MQMKASMKRLLSMILALAMLAGVCPFALAASTDRSLSFEEIDGVSADVRLDVPPMEKTEENVYADTDTVRVSIVLEDAPTLELFSTKEVAENISAMTYRNKLKATQDTVAASIEKQVLKDSKLDVVWNMTLAANIISANVKYGQIEAIAAVDGVKQVVVETSYDPLETNPETADPFMSTSSGMIGAGTAWSSGYTGAGTRIAVIDTGLDLDHQSFDNGAFLYSLAQLAEKKGMDADAYIASLNLMTAEDIAAVYEELNIYPYVQYHSGTANGDYYVNEKVPFAVSYVDHNYEATHDDGISEHGSHVAGIAAANSYIPDGEGYQNALDSVYTQGVAPDAQLVIMKVFSAEGGGAYDSDYMAAIEDAIMLGCDVVNLSLGSNKDFARSPLYQDILDSLQESNTVVAIASGNAGQWATYAASGSGLLYGDDIDMSTMSSPAAATNALAVGSVENVGTTDYYISVDDQYIYYNLGVKGDAYAPGLNEIGGIDREYILIDGIGTVEQVLAAAEKAENVSEAILVCARGEINFSEKVQNAYDAGFAGVIVYNNAEGIFSMNLDGYTGTSPAVSVTMADGAALQAAAEQVSAEGDAVALYKGTMFVSDQVRSEILNGGSYEMSEFSSWGLAGSLELKPEISAPGGNIYSVDGSDPNGDAYMVNSGTSMASPQIAGMAAVAMQYVKENGLEETTGLTARQLVTSLLMSTATPLTDSTNGDFYYPVLQQGAGLANLGNALQANTYIQMDEDATSGATVGKVKVELGDDPDRNGIYSFGFTIENFSDHAETYALASSFFTQGLVNANGTTYLDTQATPLSVAVSYSVDSESLSASSDYACDLNGDGLTDALDAQIILDYAAGNDVAAYLDAIQAKADLDENGKVNTYDAHLLLASVKSDYFRVEAGEGVHVEITVELTHKAGLDENYVNGAYVEGFVLVNPAPSEEGEVDVAHSIPVIGFYGNWSDASMYDRGDYEDYMYYSEGAESEFLYPYSGSLNYITYFDGNEEYMMIGNPYIVEDAYPAGREALTSKTELGDFVVTLIRSAGGFLYFIKDETTGELVHADSSEQLNAAYYYDSYGQWVYGNSVGLSIWETPKSYGFEDGDKFTFGFMSVPEYYETDGALSTEELVALMESGKIGEGAFHTRTFTVDDTAPELLSVEKDEATGNLTIKAKDNQYIAAIAVLNAKGNNVLEMTTAQQTEANTATETVVDMSTASAYVDGDCMIMIADYAGNETYYLVEDYNEGYGTYVGRMYGFTNAANRGTANSWMEIMPENLYYWFDAEENITKIDGTVDVANMPWAVVAAEYVHGYIYMATEDGKLYVAPQGDWENASIAATDTKYAALKDMTFNAADGKLYALHGSSNTIYSIDLVTGALTSEYTVSIAQPEGRTNFTAENYELLTLTCDGEGNFYAVNDGNSTYQKLYLYSWSAEDVADGEVKDLAPVNNTKEGYAGDYIYNAKVSATGFSCIQSMAYDRDAGVLYWAAALSTSSPYNYLYTFDTETGKATIATGSIAGIEDWACGTLSSNVSGLYIVPEEDGEIETPAVATDLILGREELRLLEGAVYEMAYDVTPWNLADKTVTWTTSDDTVATVGKDGTINAISVGTATITATTVAEPKLTASCTVTVEKIEDVDLRGLIYDGEAKANWSEFTMLDPQSWAALAGGEDIGYDFIAGGLLGNTLYVHNGDHMYGVDANTFEVTDYGYVDPSWQWSDADQAPLNADGYFGRIVGIINGGKAFGVMDVRNSIGTEMTHYSAFRNDSAAVIAYKGETEYTDEYGSYLAYEYYVLTEGGDLYLMTTWGFYDSTIPGTVYTDALEKIGETGLRLTGVSDVTSGKYGSMVYDGNTGYLIVSVCNGNVNKLYAFEPDMCTPVQVGEFESGVYPVVAMHQYVPFDELTVVIEPEIAEIYVGEEAPLDAKVYRAAADYSVRWESMDETVATVDENGVVTGVRAGEVEIRAYSVEDDTVYGSATVTVKALTAVNTKLHAYITTAEGGKWIAIDGMDLSYNTLGLSDAVYTGAAVADGKIYATDREYYYEIDPGTDYTAVKGDNFTDGNSASFMYMLDGTSAPVSNFTVPNYGADGYATGENAEIEVGGKPVYLSGYDSGYSYLTILNDYQKGEFLVSQLNAVTYSPAAVAWYYSEIIEGYYFDFYYILGYDGLLQNYSFYGASVEGEYVLVGAGYESDIMDTGLEFSDEDDISLAYVETDSFTGVIITHATENGTDFYAFDVTNNTIGKLGRIDEATDLVGLSLLSDVPDAPVPQYKQVTYRVVNGTWADGSSADLTLTVKLGEDGTATVEVPTGMIALEGYEGGAWDVEPTGTVSGTKPVVYTYTFTEKVEEPGLKLFGYLKIGSSYVYASIDPAKGSYDSLANSTTAYLGVGAGNGKVYAVSGSQYGSKTWYEIDPANSFAATAGYSGYGAYMAYDGAAVPAQTVTIGGKDYTVGGYMAFSSWQFSSAKMYIVTDYTIAQGFTELYSASSIGGKAYAIAYVSTEIVDSTCNDTFLVLRQDGKLVKCVVSYSATASTKSYEMSCEVLNKTLGLSGISSSANNCSMTTLGEDLYAFSVNTDEGVVLYSYVLSTDTLTELCTLDVDSLQGLSLLTDVTGGEGSDPSEPEEPEVQTKEVTFKVVNGTWADGTTADIVETVTLTDGIGTVEVPAGMVALEGYEGGAWDVEPTGTVSGTDPITYTYTFTEKVVEPQEPAVSDYMLHGYISTENGNVWASIDTSDMSWTARSSYEWVNYSGAAVSDGMIYATDEYASGYVCIDPENSYLATTGAYPLWGSPMGDGTSASVKSVEIFDTYYEDYYFVNVGIPMYVVGDANSGENMVMFLADYTDTYSVSYRFLDVWDSLAVAITYVSSEMDEFNEWYKENYLVLFDNGDLYDLTVKYTLREDEVSRSVTLGDYVSTGLSVSSQTSMTLVEEGKIVIAIGGDEGVSFYLYDVENATASLLGKMEDAATLVGLSLLSDISDEQGSDPEDPEDPVDPEEPSGSDFAMHGYISTENGNVWASIDTSDMSWEALSTYEWVNYSGAALSDGKLYATDEYASGYVCIDPENGYAATTGTYPVWGIAMGDGTSAPVKSVEIFDTYYEDYYFVNVGTPLYVVGDENSGENMIISLFDYTNSGSQSYRFLDVWDSLAVGITYVSSEMDEFNEWYQENYLVLFDNGDIYDFAVKYTLREDQVSRSLKLGDCVYTDLSFDGQVSMALVAEGKVMISAGGDEGVSFYLYDVESNAAELLGVVEDAASLVGLSLLSEIPAGESDDPADPENPEDPEDPEEPENPEDPAGSDYVMHAYVSTSNGNAWVSIDTADMSFDALSDYGYVSYTGAALSDGLIYATDSWAENYVCIDPENYYLATTGAAPMWGSAMGDGTSAAVKSAEIFDTYFEDYYFVNVGTPMYVVGDKNSGENIVFSLFDYTDTASVTYRMLDVWDSLAVAMTYVSSEMDEFNEWYQENYVILFDNGDLYDLAVKYTLREDEVSRTIKLGDCVSTGLTVSGKASMALVDTNKVMIAVSGSSSVSFYTYDLEAAALETVGTLRNAWNLVGLSLLSDLTANRSMTLVTDTVSDMPMAKAETESRMVKGSLMTTGESNGTVDAENSTVTINVTEDVAVTNGLVEITYDADKLEFVSAVSGNAYISVNSTEPGKLILAYASATEIEAGLTIAGLKFSFTAPEYDENTDIVINALERNEEAELEEEAQAVTVTLPGVNGQEPEPCEHEYVAEITRYATDTEDGEILYTCSKCGDSYTEAIPANCASAHFVDLLRDAWYHESVDYMVARGLMNGISATEFNPDGTLTRAMMVTILYRVAGEPEVTEASGFADVADGLWYTEAINWAASEGIVNGYTSTQFAPDDAVTREQMATILYRYAKSLGIDTAAYESTDLSAFADSTNVSAYALTAMRWACGVGIIRGMSADEIAPQGNATRVQVAAMFQRFCENVLDRS